MPREAKWPYAAIGLGAMIFLYMHLFHFPFVPIWHWGDQSIFLEHAQRMLHGEVLYRDLFQLNLPGTEYLYYFLFLCFGVRMWIAPLAVLVALTADALLVYSLSRVVLRGSAALLPAVAFLVVYLQSLLDGAHHLFSTTLIFLAVNLIARARNSFWICCAGAALGLSTLFTSSKGVFVAIAVCLFFIWKFSGRRDALRAIAVLLVPFFTVVAAMLAYLATTTAPGTLFEWLVVFPLRYYPAGRFNTPAAFFAELNSVLPLRTHSVLVLGLWLAAKALVPALLIAFLVWFFYRRAAMRRRSPSHQALVLYFLAGSFALLAEASSLSMPRLNCAAAFAYILGTAMLHDLGQRRLIGAALATVSVIGLAEITAAIIRPVQKFDSPRGSVVFLHRRRYEMVAWLSRHARPGDELFGDPDLNFVLNLSDPAGVQWVEPDAFTRPQQVRELLTALRQRHTRFIVWSPSVDRTGPGDDLQPLRAYLKEHYHLAQSFGDSAEIFVVNAAPPSSQ